MLRRIFGRKRDEGTVERRRLRNEELNGVFSQNIMQVIKSKRMRRAGHVAFMGERVGAYRGNLRERDHLEVPGIDGKIILRWIFKKWDVGTWTGLIWLRIGTGGGIL